MLPKWAMSDSERLRPDETRQALAEREATAATYEQALEDRESSAEASEGETRVTARGVVQAVCNEAARVKEGARVRREEQTRRADETRLAGEKEGLNAMIDCKPPDRGRRYGIVRQPPGQLRRQFVFLEALRAQCAVVGDRDADANLFHRYVLRGRLRARDRRPARLAGYGSALACSPQMWPQVRQGPSVVPAPTPFDPKGFAIAFPAA